LLFSGLEAIAYNKNRRRSDLKLFEFGKTYHNYESGREEHKHLSLFVTGKRSSDTWTNDHKNSDFFYLKGIVQSIFERLGIQRTRTANLKDAIFAEGTALQLGKTTLVSFGTVKKSVLKAFDIDQEVLYADFNWDNILEVAARNSITFKAIPKYPAVRRDFALLIDEKVTFEAIHTMAKQTEKQLLKDVNLFDVYQGKNLPEGKKSYALSFMLQDEHKTLTDKQIDKVMNKLQQRFEKELGASLR
jgi:phenylalanyl-tRNA synthetase beta chain